MLRGRSIGRAFLLTAAFVSLATAVPASAADSSTKHVGVLADGAAWQAELPSDWNGTLLLFSHGYGQQEPQDSPDPQTGQDLLDDGYALAGSSYDPKGSLWGLNSAVRDQFQTLAAVKKTVLPSRPKRVIAIGQSMGGLVSALEDQSSNGRLDGSLTTCGLVAGGINLENYQLNGSQAISTLLAPGEPIQLAGYASPADAALAATQLQQAAQQAQNTPQGRARLALASALYNVPTWTTTNLLSQNTNPLLVPPASGPAPAGDYNQQELEQYYTQYAPGSIVLPFIQTGRRSIEQSANGQPSWDAGVDFAKLLHDSPYKPEVKALYRAAGLDLDADLKAVTKSAHVKADPAAVHKLTSTSVASGKLQVPELNIHTIADQLIPVQQENYYARKVEAAGSGRLLRQAFVFRQGHCNFTPAEIIAALHGLEHRIKSGEWGDTASAHSLQAAAKAQNRGDAAYVHYEPSALTTTTEPFDPKTQGSKGALPVKVGSGGPGLPSPPSIPSLTGLLGRR